MSRLTGTVGGLALFCLILPAVAETAQGLVPALLALFLVLAVARLVMPPTRRRRD